MSRFRQLLINHLLKKLVMLLAALLFIFGIFAFASANLYGIVPIILAFIIGYPIDVDLIEREEKIIKRVLKW